MDSYIFTNILTVIGYNKVLRYTEYIVVVS